MSGRQDALSLKSSAPIPPPRPASLLNDLEDSSRGLWEHEMPRHI
jgi:hypothetical protein